MTGYMVLLLHSLQWVTLERKMPVVYYGTESGSYSYVKMVYYCMT